MQGGRKEDGGGGEGPEGGVGGAGRREGTGLVIALEHGC